MGARARNVMLGVLAACAIGAFVLVRWGNAQRESASNESEGLRDASLVPPAKEEPASEEIVGEPSVNSAGASKVSAATDVVSAPTAPSAQAPPEPLCAVR